MALKMSGLWGAGVLAVGVMGGLGSVSAQTIIPAGTLNGQATPGRDGCYLFDAPAGTSWQVEMQSGSFDSYIYIGAGTSCLPNSAQIRNDDGGDGLNSKTKFTSGGGVYFIQTSNFSGGGMTGPYALIIRQDRGGRQLPPGGRFIQALLDSNPDSASTVVPSAEAGNYLAGQTFRDCSDRCPQLTVVPAGTFMMGSSAGENGRAGDEGPYHAVTIARAFAIATYEVTFDEFLACADDGGCSRRPADQGWGMGRRPVINVTWTDAAQYVEWLSLKTGQRYFLPSEAEWEYAARAGSSSPWNTGSAIISDDANIINVIARTVPVGGFPANAFGLHDMHGNVIEWVRDCYDVGYFGVPADGGAMVQSMCPRRVARGGHYESTPATARSAARLGMEFNATGNGTGFRVARAL